MYGAASAGDFEMFPHPSMQPSIEDHLFAPSCMCTAGKQYISQPCSEEYDANVLKAHETPEPDTRRPAQNAAPRHLVEDCTSLWIGRLNTYHVRRKEVTNFRPSYMYAMDLRNTAWS